MRLAEIIRTTIEIGRRNGFVTFDQLNELPPATTTEPEDIEALLQALREEKIDLRDNP